MKRDYHSTNYQRLSSYLAPEPKGLRTLVGARVVKKPTFKPATLQGLFHKF